MIILISASTLVTAFVKLMYEVFISATALQYHAWLNVVQYLENCDVCSKWCKQ